MKSSTNRRFAISVLAACISAYHISYAASQAGETAETPTNTPVNVIFDTDIWSDNDDALALAMVHALNDRHEINLLAVTISTDDPWTAPYVDLVDTFYGRPQIPVGLGRNGMNTEAFRKKFPELHWPVTEYTRLVSQLKNKDGSALYPHRLTTGTMAPEAVPLLRKVLAEQPDGSVVMIQVGYSTNLARLLDTGPDTVSALGGRDLIRKKVRLLSVMAGSYGPVTIDGKTHTEGVQEFNLQADVPSAQHLFSTWPTPIVASGLDVCTQISFPAYSIGHDYAYVANHPVADAFRLYSEETKKNWPQASDGGSCDPTSVLYAARPDRNYFSLSKPGKITVLPDGSSRFDETPGGTHRHLILTAAQKARTLEAMVMLASQPPRLKK